MLHHDQLNGNIHIFLIVSNLVQAYSHWKLVCFYCCVYFGFFFLINMIKPLFDTLVEGTKRINMPQIAQYMSDNSERMFKPLKTNET